MGLCVMDFLRHELRVLINPHCPRLILLEKIVNRALIGIRSGLNTFVRAFHNTK